MIFGNMQKTYNSVLSVAGSDCSAGAGIQADIKTMTVNGVRSIMEVTPGF